MYCVLYNSTNALITYLSYVLHLNPARCHHFNHRGEESYKSATSTPPTTASGAGLQLHSACNAGSTSGPLRTAATLRPRLGLAAAVAATATYEVTPTTTGTSTSKEAKWGGSHVYVLRVYVLRMYVQHVLRTGGCTSLRLSVYYIRTMKTTIYSL